MGLELGNTLSTVKVTIAVNGQCTSPQNASVITLRFEHTVELLFDYSKGLPVVVALTSQTLIFFHIRGCWMHNLGRWVAEVEVVKAGLRNEAQSGERPVKSIEELFVFVAAFFIEMGVVKAARAASEGKRREHP